MMSSNRFLVGLEIILVGFGFFILFYSAHLFESEENLALADVNSHWSAIMRSAPIVNKNRTASAVQLDRELCRSILGGWWQEVNNICRVQIEQKTNFFPSNEPADPRQARARGRGYEDLTTTGLRCYHAVGAARCESHSDGTSSLTCEGGMKTFLAQGLTHDGKFRKNKYLCL